MAIIATGAKAPDFVLPLDDGGSFRLSEHKGKPVVLFFYPQDDTGGCTIENQEFSELIPEFEKLGATVIGICPDSIEAHCKFRDKYRLRAPLAADPDLKAIKKYGVWGPKVLFGHQFDGLLRNTVIVGADGKVAGVYAARRIKGHAKTVLEATRKLATKG